MELFTVPLASWNSITIPSRIELEARVNKKRHRFRFGRLGGGNPAPEGALPSPVPITGGPVWIVQLIRHD